MSDRPTAAQIETAQRVTALLDRLGGGVIIGGVAVSLLGNPRATKDVDAMLFLGGGDIDPVYIAALSAGFTARFDGMLEFARRARVLVLQDRLTGTTVDIALGATPFESEVVEGGKIYEHDGTAIRLPAVEDLIILKGIAHRLQDLADIAAVAEVNPTLDRLRIRHWLKQFAELLDSPDVLTDVERILDRVLS